MMNRKAIPPVLEQERWKQTFEGSLSSLNGGVLPPSKQPIFARHSRFTPVGPDFSKEAISAAAASLAALWQISSPKRRAEANR